MRGSRNREKVRQRIARLYALIGDVRRDMLDRFTTRLVRENQVLVVEDLVHRDSDVSGSWQGQEAEGAAE